MARVHGARRAHHAAPRRWRPLRVFRPGAHGQCGGCVAGLRADVIVFAEGAFGSSKDVRRAMWEASRACRCSPSSCRACRRVERAAPGPAGRGLALGTHRGSSGDAGVPVGQTGLRRRRLPGPLWSSPRRDGRDGAAVKLHDGGPVLFRQTRVGRDGKRFECLKLRTHGLDAEQLPAVPRGPTGRTCSSRCATDPRVTRPGPLLRRFSLDELPQLSTCAGRDEPGRPAPAAAAEVRSYEDDATRRLHVRPGMTGLWQVSGRSDLRGRTPSGSTSTTSTTGRWCRTW